MGKVNFEARQLNYFSALGTQEHAVLNHPLNREAPTHLPPANNLPPTSGGTMTIPARSILFLNLSFRQASGCRAEKESYRQILQEVVDGQ